MDDIKALKIRVAALESAFVEMKADLETAQKALHGSDVMCSGLSGLVALLMQDAWPAANELEAKRVKALQGFVTAGPPSDRHRAITEFLDQLFSSAAGPPAG